MIRQSEAPVVGDLCREAFVSFVADFTDEVVVKSEFVVRGHDQVGIDVPDLNVN